MVALCHDDAVIGSDFYVMERVDGTIPRRDLPTRGGPRRGRRRRLVHGTRSTCWSGCTRSTRAAAGLGALGKGDGLRRAAGRGLVRAASARRAPTNVAELRRDGDGLARRAPARRRRELRDPQRLPLRQPGARRRTTRPRVVGVLDWEMATLGDPLMDLGGALAYWVQDDDDEFFRQFRRQPTHLPGMLTPRRGGASTTPTRWARGHAGAVAVLRGVRAVPARP